MLPARPAYLDATAAWIGLHIDPADREAVNGDLNRLAAIAEFLMQFPLSQDVEAAAVFRP